MEQKKENKVTIKAIVKEIENVYTDYRDEMQASYTWHAHVESQSYLVLVELYDHTREILEKITKLEHVDGYFVYADARTKMLVDYNDLTQKVCSTFVSDGDCYAVSQSLETRFEKVLADGIAALDKFYTERTHRTLDEVYTERLGCTASEKLIYDINAAFREAGFEVTEMKRSDYRILFYHKNGFSYSLNAREIIDNYDQVYVVSLNPQIILSYKLSTENPKETICKLEKDINELMEEKCTQLDPADLPF